MRAFFDHENFWVMKLCCGRLYRNAKELLDFQSIVQCKKIS